MKKTREWIFLCLVIAVIFLLQSIDTSAMPAFSRKYRTSCVTCHEAPPRLNATGESYRLNGYRFSDDELFRKEDPQELGDDAHKRVWPDSLWPSDIPPSPPISIMTKWIMEYNHDPVYDPLTDDEQAEVVFILPHEAELAWAAAFGDTISAYGDMIYFQEDFGKDVVYTWLAIKARIEFQDLVGPENLVNLALGSVGVNSIGLYTARPEQSLSIQPYVMYSWTMPGLINIEDNFFLANWLKDFEGNDFVVQAQTGMELYGFGKKWLYYVGIVNGNIENPSGAEPEDQVFVLGAGRNTNKKDYYAGLAYKFGGAPLDGSNLSENASLPASSADFWRDDSLTLSVFGYIGTWKIAQSIYDDDPETVPVEHIQTETDDNFYRLAFGALWKHRDLTLNVGYMFGRNDNPYGLLDERSVDSHAWFIEGHYFLYPWMIPYARFDSLQIDDLPEQLFLWDEQDRDVITLGIKTLVRPNITLQIESQIYTYDDGYDYPLNESLFLMLTANF